MGMLSIAAAPGALLVSPTMFPLLSFFFALMGLTIAAPKNRFLSIIGMVAAGICGAVGFYFNTPIV
jgi:lipopolysaccharide export LptBFGC system permease protein LptF